MSERSNTVIIDGDDAGFDRPYIAPNRSDSGTGSTPDTANGNENGPGRTQNLSQPTDHGFETLTPFDIGTGSGNEPPTARPRKRGRPRGSTNTPKSDAQATATTQNLGGAALESLEALLLGVHFMGAKLLQEPSIELDEGEAKKFSDALKNVAKQYQTVVDPKKLALIQLSTVMAGIYVPRILTLYKGSSKGPARVINIRPDRETQPTEARQSQQAKQPEKPRPQSPSELFQEFQFPVEDS